jgi:hypothetical protein
VGGWARVTLVTRAVVVVIVYLGVILNALRALRP